MTPELDIVIPVYNEGHNIVAVLAALKHALDPKGILNPGKMGL